MKPDDVMWRRINALFSVVMVMDRELRIVHSSDTLQRYVPKVALKPTLSQVFNVQRPASVTTFEDFRSHPESLYLMVTMDRRFAIRGQVLDISEDYSDQLCFFGAPWLSWLHSNRPELTLGLGDFTPQDAQMDQLFYISTEARMVEDLENLNLQMRSAKEELEAAQQAKSAFFAQMSHEMRTPLNGVISAVTLLRDQGLTGQAEGLLDLAMESSHNLMQVINYVLDVSKIEHSGTEVVEAPFDLPELLESLTDIVRARAMVKGLSMRSQIDGRLPSTYIGDASLLRQVLLNLVINAIKFTDRGEVIIEVRPATSQGMTLHIEVIDTGVGIPEEYKTAIFEPFRTFSTIVTGDSPSGTGLGLDIARRNIECMGGEIGVESTPGQGSTFWVELPCESAETSVDISPGKHSPGGSDLRLSGHVLLVDDNDTNLMLGRMILESMGIQVTCASSGKEAVATAMDAEIDLVLMDINMPEIDGFDTTRYIRAFRDADSLPIIALTAFASSVEREKSVACGMNGYLTKPIEREELADALATWLPGFNVPSVEAEVIGSPDNPGQVDLAVLHKLADEIGSKNLVTVVGKFLDEVDTRRQALESAGNKEDLAREAHTLASTCRSFGLPSVAEKFACIERHARFGDAPGGPPCVTTTGRELMTGAKALRSAVELFRSQSIERRGDGTG